MHEKMIQKETLKQVMLENRIEVERHNVVPRNIVMEEFANYVLIGVRRAGKSYMLYQQMQQNIKQGIGWDSMLYINFEDERLIEMTAEDLNLILEVHGILSPKRPILFLDEIQNISGWEKFARRLADNGYRVYITGSNSKMLSSDVATTLGGRYITVHLFPYTLREFLTANGVSYEEEALATTSGRSSVHRLFESYFRFGGFPEGALLSAKRDYLTSVYQKIYIGDIAERNKIDNHFALRILFRKIVESIGQPISFTRLTNVVSSVGVKVSKSTLINYMEYARNAFLIYPIKNMAENLTGKESSPKYYMVDNGMVSLLALDVDTALLENVVAIELLRKFGIDDRVFFYNRNIEVDFYIPDVQCAIQVSYNPRKTEDTWQRETQALLKVSDVLPCNRLLILSYEGEETVCINNKTIEVIPVWKWLLGNDL
jgi:predicted AAA+ superfamily ATPase